MTKAGNTCLPQEGAVYPEVRGRRLFTGTQGVITTERERGCWAGQIPDGCLVGVLPDQVCT
jgi:hypothetical protein